MSNRFPTESGASSASLWKAALVLLPCGKRNDFNYFERKAAKFMCLLINPDLSANCAPGQGLSLVCFPCDLERQKGRLRRIPSLKTPSLRVRLPAQIRNAAPPSVGERGTDFGKTGRENRPRNALRSKHILSPFRPPLGETSKEQIFTAADEIRAPALCIAEGWEDRGAKFRFKFRFLLHPTHLWCIGRGRSVSRVPRGCLCLIRFACNGMRYAFSVIPARLPRASMRLVGFISFAIMAETRNISRNMKNERDTFSGAASPIDIGDFRYFLRHKRNFFSCPYTAYPFFDDYAVSLCSADISRVTRLESYSVSYIRYRKYPLYFKYLV